jgi:Holliday junction resolvase-like predicted endonuclease
MSKAALWFLKERGLLDTAARFDVVSVVDALPEPTVSIIRNAFECPQEYMY